MDAQGMTPAQVRAYYSRPEILDAIFSMCADREVIPVFAGGYYGKRPNSVQFKGDLLHFIKNSAVSFHCSVEHWRNPLALGNDLKRPELDALRTGWDFVLDIDSDAGIDVAKITANLLIEELKKNGVKSISLKFSGRRGFHIGVPFAALPEVVNLAPTSAQFPSLAQKIAHFLKFSIKEKLAEEMISYDAALEPRITDGRGQDPYSIVEVEDNWSVRHLFRMPFSLNEKVWRVSLPINPSHVMSFSPEEANPDAAKPDFGFLGSAQKNEAEQLVRGAIEFDSIQKAVPGSFGREQKKDKNEALRRHLTDGYGVIVIDEEKRRSPASAKGDAQEGDIADSPESYMLSGIRARNPGTGRAAGARIPEEYFPPCIKKILEGLIDGRKRAIFVMINFLHTVGWGWDEIDKRLIEWNAKNPEPIADSYLKGQLEYARKQDKNIPPPNCSNAGYYKDIKVCIPDSHCTMIKNPAGYAARKSAMEEGKKKKMRQPGRKGKQRNEIPHL